MKNTALILAALVASVSLIGEEAAAPSSSWVVTPSFASQYMFRGTRLGGPAFQPSVEYDQGNFAAGIWSNVPLKDKVIGQSDPELDFYGSYSTEVAKNLTVVPGITVYYYPNADRTNGFYKSTYEPNIALNYSIESSLGVLKLTPKLYYDFILKGPTAEFTAAFTVPLKDISSELDFTGTYGSFKWKDYAPNNTPDIKNWGDYYLLGVAMPFQVSKASKLTVGFAYTKGSNNYLKQGTDAKVLNSAAVGRGVVTLSYAITF